MIRTVFLILAAICFGIRVKFNYPEADLMALGLFFLTLGFLF